LWNLLKELNAGGKLTPAQAVLCAPTMPEEELYDLQADPWQTNNLAQSPPHRETLLRLRAAVEQWIQETDDRGRFPEASPPPDAESRKASTSTIERALTP
jgi:hypothetical protein